MRRSHDFGTEFSGERYLMVGHRSQSFQQDQAWANFILKSRLCNKNNILENVACPWQSAFLPDYKYFTYFYAHISWSEVVWIASVFLSSQFAYYAYTSSIWQLCFSRRKTVSEKIRSYRIRWHHVETSRWI